MQTHRQRLGKREFAQRDVAAHRIALALAHHEIFLEHALHVGKPAGTAQEFHVGAQLLAAVATSFAMTTGVRWRHGDLVALFHTRNALPDRRNDRRGLMPRDQRLAHDEVAVAALEVVVQIGAANAGGAKLQQYFARAW